MFIIDYLHTQEWVGKGVHSMMFIVTGLFAVAFKVVLKALDSLSNIPGWVLMAARVSEEIKGLV